MLVGSAEHALHVIAIHVVSAGDESGFCRQPQRNGVERLFQRAERGGFRYLAHFARGRILALGETVYLVVEQQNLDFHIAAQGVDEMVAADGEHVAVSADDPDVQIGARHGQPSRNSRSAAVDSVKPVGVHVIRKPGGAADARDEDCVLHSCAELGHKQLHGRQHRIVAAAGAPAGFLVARPVGFGGDGGFAAAGFAVPARGGEEGGHAVKVSHLESPAFAR